jgi:hypothetical protein
LKGDRHRHASTAASRERPSHSDHSQLSRIIQKSLSPRNSGSSIYQAPHLGTCKIAASGASQHLFEIQGSSAFPAESISTRKFKIPIFLSDISF